MRKTLEVMGTVASLDVPSCEDADVFDSVFERLKQIDNDYSPFKETSLVSLFNRGGLPKPPPEFQKIVKACQDWQKATNGVFSAWYKGDKKYEPSGYVKGWAISEAAKVIKRKGYKTYCISIGGDVLAASSGKKTWNIGIQDPSSKLSVVKTLAVQNGAIATSGAYERGLHIINPKTGKPAKKWKSVSIVGPDIISADVLATASFAMPDAADFLDSFREYKYLLINQKGQEISSL